MARKRHTPGTLPYFSVSGERRASEVSPETGELRYLEEVLPVRTRFETISLQDAERFATSVYKTEGVVCEIHEHAR